MALPKRNIVLILIALTCFSIVGLIELRSCHDNRTYTKEQIDEIFKPITARYGTEIVFIIRDDFFSSLVNPPIPNGPARDCNVIPIKHQILIKYPAILKKALEKYPDHLIKKYLKGIYFAGDIEEDGFHYSGSYDPFRRIIYLVDDGQKDDYDAIHTFHHEFSSILLKSHSFFLNPWFDQNPKDFIYLSDIHSNWKDMKIAFKSTRSEYSKGFISDYGQVTYENDFNEYSGMIFTYPQKFKRIMDQYPRVRGKFLVWLKFYQEIDPIFTEDYLFGETS